MPILYSDPRATGFLAGSGTTLTIDQRRTTSSKQTFAHRVARSLVDAIGSEPSLKAMWAWSEPGYIEPGREYVELWLYAHPADPDSEQRLRRAGATLHASYPEANIRVHTITPPMVDGLQPAGQVRDGAEEVALETS